VEKMEALGLMAGGVAHEFSNVLGAMMGFAELAKDHAPKESRQEHHLRRVLQAGDRGRELIGQLLAFSRKKGVELKPLRLSSVVRETLELLRSSIPPWVAVKSDVDFEADVVLGDAGQIQEVVRRLCMNAVQAMGEKGGVLDVALSGVSVPAQENADGTKPGAYVRLVISDTGCGMPPDVVDKAFDPFFTTKMSTVGLGLAVIWGIVRQHGGCIAVESAPGKGAVFTVCLPRAAQAS
jgi:signal transduction histidine kinase